MEGRDVEEKYENGGRVIVGGAKAPFSEGRHFSHHATSYNTQICMSIQF